MLEKRVYHGTSEYIIWRAESKMQVKEEHPDWDEETVNRYLDAVEDKILQNQPEFFSGMAERRAASVQAAE